MRNYVDELRKLADKEPYGLYRELADYMNHRLIKTNKTIFEYVPTIDGIHESKIHLLPLVKELIEKGFFDGN